MEDNNISISFSFKTIEILESYIKLPLNQPPDFKVFSFDISTEIQIIPDNSLIVIILSIKIFNESKDLHLGSLTTSCIFFVENFKEVVKMDSNNNFKISDQFLVSLNSISISTTRGIMWSTFKGTFLHNALLPIIDPKPNVLSE